jgi:holo-[acyl-carrier protein] synthase
MTAMGSIVGVGVDVVEVARLREAMERQEGRFAGKIFTDAEIAYCRARKHPFEHFAARFAAKEAVAKALQTGWSGVFQWKDVEVMNDPSGAPHVLLHNKMAEQLRGKQIHLSLSHTEFTVIAFAVIESV